MTSTLKLRLDGAHQAFVHSLCCLFPACGLTHLANGFTTRRESLHSWLPLAEETGGKGRKGNVFSPSLEEGIREAGQGKLQRAACGLPEVGRMELERTVYKYRHDLLCRVARDQ